ncbi:MAG: hypothetical protein K2Z81_20360 [Cyanobacteria bacterium]|nr:hypothetical protein [Cyanobacteriota bacterium]
MQYGITLTVVANHFSRRASILSNCYNADMQITDYRITVKGTRQSAWEKLVHWQSMHEWDIFMDYVKFDGPLAMGSVGKLKMKGGPKVDLRVTHFAPPDSYTDEFSMLGSTFIFHHEVIEQGAGEVEIHIMVEAQGLLANVLAPFMRKDMDSKMPILMQNFKHQYEHERTVARSQDSHYLK